MKWFIRKIAKPRPQAQLIKAIQQFKKTKLNVKLCNKYIDHLYKVVLNQKEKASGF